MYRKTYPTEGISMSVKVTPQCIPCLLKRCLFETDLVDPTKQDQVMEGAIRIIAHEFSYADNSARLATDVHRYVYDTIGSSDPYLELKLRSNDVVKDLIPKAKELVENSDDPLRTAILISICGNLLDFGAALIRHVADEP